MVGAKRSLHGRRRWRMHPFRRPSAQSDPAPVTLLDLSTELGVHITSFLADDALDVLSRACTRTHWWTHDQRKQRLQWHGETLHALAARPDGIQALRWARRRAANQGRADFAFESMCFESAAAAGRTETLAWLYADLRAHRMPPRCSATALLCLAAGQNRFETVRWMLREMLDVLCVSRAVRIAVSAGASDCLAPLYEACRRQGCHPNGDGDDDDAVLCARDHRVMAFLHHERPIRPREHLAGLLSRARDVATLDWLEATFGDALDWRNIGADLYESLAEAQHTGVLSRCDTLERMAVLLHSHGFGLCDSEWSILLLYAAIGRGALRLVCALADLVGAPASLHPQAAMRLQGETMGRWFPEWTSRGHDRDRVPACGNSVPVKVRLADLESALDALCEARPASDVDDLIERLMQRAIKRQQWGLLERLAEAVRRHHKPGAAASPPDRERDRGNVPFNWGDLMSDASNVALEYGDRAGLDAIDRISLAVFEHRSVWTGILARTVESGLLTSCRYAADEHESYPFCDDGLLGRRDCADAVRRRGQGQQNDRSAFIIYLCGRFPGAVRAASLHLGNKAAHISLDALRSLVALKRRTWSVKFLYASAQLGNVDAMCMALDHAPHLLRSMDPEEMATCAAHSAPVCAFLCERRALAVTPDFIRTAARMGNWEGLSLSVSIGALVKNHAMLVSSDALAKAATAGHVAFVEALMRHLPHTDEYASLMRSAGIKAMGVLRIELGYRMILLARAWTCMACQNTFSRFSSSSSSSSSSSFAPPSLLRNCVDVPSATLSVSHPWLALERGPCQLHPFIDCRTNDSCMWIMNRAGTSVTHRGPPVALDDDRIDGNGDGGARLVSLGARTERVELASRLLNALSYQSAISSGYHRADMPTMYEAMSWVRRLCQQHAVARPPPFCQADADRTLGATEGDDPMDMQEKVTSCTAVIERQLLATSTRAMYDSQADIVRNALLFGDVAEASLLIPRYVGSNKCVGMDGRVIVATSSSESTFSAHSIRERNTTDDDTDRNVDASNLWRALFEHVMTHVAQSANSGDMLELLRWVLDSFPIDRAKIERQLAASWRTPIDAADHGTHLMRALVHSRLDAATPVPTPSDPIPFDPLNVLVCF